MNNVKLLSGILAICLISISCARKKTLDDWSRQWVSTVTIGSAVELGLRQDSKFTFNVDSHCFQQVRYVDDKGVQQSEQLEIFSEACPSGSVLLGGDNRIARFATHSAGGSAIEFGNDATRPFGRVREESTFTATRLILDALCNYVEGESTQNYSANCSVVVNEGKISEIKAK